MSTEANHRAQLEAVIRANPVLMGVMETARTLNMPDWLIVSGAVYQGVWNHLTGRPADYGVKDYDLVYFDPDTSWDAEDVFIKRAASVYPPPLNELVEVRNQARVHLWFEAKFGEPYEPLANSAEALTRFVCPAFSVGARLEPDGALTIEAPFGLDDLFAMRLRPNPLRGLAAGWIRVTGSARSRWPEVVIEGP
ncbi:MAG: nucleotidyltransferase family protein [Caulobacter sp.]|nr:nucleotidyltransferase family protein [Caulobacter sp.]